MRRFPRRFPRLPHCTPVRTSSYLTVVAVVAGSVAAGSVAGPATAATGVPPAAAVSVDGVVTMPRGVTVSGRPVHYRSIDMSAGQLFYADDTSEGPRTAVWRRTVTGTGALRFGAPARIAEGSVPPIAFSAGRGAVGGAGWRWSDDGSASGPLDLLDRGTRLGQVDHTGYFTADRTVLSGPFLLPDAYGSTVLRADGSTAFAGATEPEIFGSRVIWVSGGTLRVRDLAAETPVTRVVTVPGCPCQRVAGTWGDAVVLLAVNRTTHRGAAILHDLRSGTSRALGVTMFGDGGDLAEVGDGVLAWGDTDGLYALDLTVAGAVPLRVSPDTHVQQTSMALDAGRLAWIAGNGTVKVAPLPFGGRSLPRLLGVLAPRGLSPDGDGALDTWRPSIDVTAPLDDVRVTIRRGADLVRALSGSAPDGSVRDVVWNGRDDAGAVVPPGEYAWTLTGTGATGAVTGIDGTGPVTGSVTVGPLGYAPLREPRRVLDTRKGVGAPKARVGAGHSRTVAVGGVAGVPRTGVSAVVLSVTAATPTAAGAVTVHPAGGARPDVANLAFDAGRTTTTTTLTQLGSGGRVTLWNRSGTVDLYADVVGWFPTTGSAYRPVTRATTIADTRSGLGFAAAGPLGPDGARRTASFQVAGRGGIPASGPAGVALTVTATGATKATDLVVHAPREQYGVGASSVRVPAAPSVATSLALTGLDGATGQASVSNPVAGRTQVSVGATGWFTSPGVTALAPTRIVDTREGLHVTAGRVSSAAPAHLQLTGYGRLPTTGVTAVVLGVTVRDATSKGALILYRGHPARAPVARTVSFEPGRTTSAFVVAPVDNAGRVTLRLTGTSPGAAAAHVVLTAQGFFTG